METEKSSEESSPGYTILYIILAFFVLAIFVGLFVYGDSPNLSVSEFIQANLAAYGVLIVLGIGFVIFFIIKCWFLKHKTIGIIIGFIVLALFIAIYIYINGYEKFVNVIRNDFL